MMFKLANYARFYKYLFWMVVLVNVSLLAAVSLDPRLAVPLITGLWLLPLLRSFLRQDDIFSPQGFLLLGYIMGWVGPALDFLHLDAADRALLLGNNISYLLVPVVISGASIGLLLAGFYSLRGETIAARIRSPPSYWNPLRASIAASVMIFIGAFFLVILVTTTLDPPVTLSEISMKRRPPSEYIRRGALLLHVGTAIIFVNLASSDIEINGPQVIVFLFGLTLSVGLPIFTSQRGLLLKFVINLLIIYHYLGRRLNLIRVFPVAVAGIIFSNVLLVYRRASWKGFENVDVVSHVGLRGIVGFFDANPIGLPTFAHIVHNVPSEMGFRFGTTFLRWIVFPVPRTIWEKKPRNLGQVLGEVIYQQGIGIVGAGTPPPMIGELYLNFGLLGLLVGSYLFGLIIRIFYTYLISMNDGPMAVLTYVVFTGFVLAIFRGDFTPTMIGILTWSIPLAFAFLYILMGKPSHPLSAIDS